MKKLKNKSPIIFVVLALVFLLTSVLFKNNSFFQFELMILMLVLYIAFSLISHHRDKSLTIEVTIEYILIAVLVLVIFTGVLVY